MFERAQASGVVKLAIGSASAVKKDATTLALRRLGLQLPVVFTSVPSGVNAQPYELRETQRGATNRALGALLICPDAAIGVGIENGLFSHNGEFADRAVCLFLVRGDGPPENWRYVGGIGAPVMMPSAAVANARARGFDKITVGQVLHEQNPQIIADNPHLFLSGRSRVDYLADTLQQLMNTLQLQGVLPLSPPLRASRYGLG